jgi:hypothetical protein
MRRGAAPGWAGQYNPVQFPLCNNEVEILRFRGLATRSSVVVGRPPARSQADHPAPMRLDGTQGVDFKGNP